MLLYFVNLATTIYIGQRPFLTLFRNRLEFMNEFFLSITSYIIVGFTNFSVSDESKSQAGRIYILFMMTNFIPNIIIVVVLGLKGVYLIIKRYYIRIFKKEKKVKICSNNEN
jgi:hypothetical protein